VLRKPNACLDTKCWLSGGLSALQQSIFWVLDWLLVVDSQRIQKCHFLKHIFDLLDYNLELIAQNPCQNWKCLWQIGWKMPKVQNFKSFCSSGPSSWAMLESIEIFA
jgi:hypothetical protein